MPVQGGKQSLPLKENHIRAIKSTSRHSSAVNGLLFYLPIIRRIQQIPTRAPAVVAEEGYACVGYPPEGCSSLQQATVSSGSLCPGTGTSAAARARRARQPPLPAVVRPLSTLAVSEPKTRKPQALQAAFFPRVREFQHVSVPSMPRKGTIFNVNSFGLLFTSLAKVPQKQVVHVFCQVADFFFSC